MVGPLHLGSYHDKMVESCCADIYSSEDTRSEDIDQHLNDKVYPQSSNSVRTWVVQIHMPCHCRCRRGIISQGFSVWTDEAKPKKKKDSQQQYLQLLSDLEIEEEDAPADLLGWLDKLKEVSMTYEDDKFDSSDLSPEYRASIVRTIIDTRFGSTVGDEVEADHISGVTCMDPKKDIVIGDHTIPDWFTSYNTTAKMPTGSSITRGGGSTHCITSAKLLSLVLMGQSQLWRISRHFEQITWIRWIDLGLHRTMARDKWVNAAGPEQSVDNLEGYRSSDERDAWCGNK